MYEAADLLYILLLAACISAVNFLISQAVARVLTRRAQPPVYQLKERLIPFTGSLRARPTSLVLPHSIELPALGSKRKREEEDSPARTGEEAAAPALPVAQEELPTRAIDDSPAGVEEEAAATAPPQAQEEREEADSPAPAGEEAAVPALLAAQEDLPEAEEEERRQAESANPESRLLDPEQDSSSGEESQSRRSGTIAEISIAAAALWSAEVDTAYFQNNNTGNLQATARPQPGLQAAAGPSPLPSLVWDSSSDDGIEITIHRSTPTPRFWVPSAGPAATQSSHFRRRFQDFGFDIPEQPQGHVPDFPDEAKDAELAKKFRDRRRAALAAIKFKENKDLNTVSRHYADLRDQCVQRLAAKEQRSLQNRAARRRDQAQNARGRGGPGSSTSSRGRRRATAAPTPGRPASAAGPGRPANPGRGHGHRTGQAEPVAVPARDRPAGRRQSGAPYAEQPARGRGRHREHRSE